MKQIFHIIMLAVLVLPVAAWAQGYGSSAFVKPEERSKSEIVEPFKFYKYVTPSVTVPTVAEVGFKSESLMLSIVAIYDMQTALFEPFTLLDNKITNRAKVEMTHGTGTESFVNISE
jgi:hypothetical protein